MSGKIKLSDMEKPADSRFFGKPLEVKQMIAELQSWWVRAHSRSSLTLYRSRWCARQAKIRGHDPSLRRAGDPDGRKRQPSAVAGTGRRVDAKALLAQAGIDAKEREAADKLQKLILEELHHRIKNTLATVSAIAPQSLRTATSIEHGSGPSKAG